MLEIVGGAALRGAQGIRYPVAGTATRNAGNAHAVLHAAHGLREVAPVADVAHHVVDRGVCLIRLAGAVLRGGSAQPQEARQRRIASAAAIHGEPHALAGRRLDPERPAAAARRVEARDAPAAVRPPAHRHAPAREVGKRARDQHADIGGIGEAGLQVHCRQAGPAVARGRADGGEQPQALVARGLAVDQIGGG